MSSPFSTCPTGNVTVDQQLGLKHQVCSTRPPPIVRDTPSNVSSAVFKRTVLWPQNTTLRVKFVDGEPWEKAWVEKVVTGNLQPLVNLKFVWDSKDSNPEISITFRTDEASSYIGTESRSEYPSMYLGWIDPPRNSFSWKGKTYTVPSTAQRNAGQYTGSTVLHEFGHALGMLHEHQNPRGEAIQWNNETVWNTFCGPPNNWDWETIQYNVLEPFTKESTNGSAFDPESIMIYSYPAHMTRNKPEGVRANSELSATDKEWLSKTYPPSLGGATTKSSVTWGVGVGVGMSALGLLLLVGLLLWWWNLRRDLQN